MAINPTDAKDAATEAVLAELLKVYENTKAEDVRPFARAVAEAARVAVTHIADRAETELSGESIR